VLDLGKFLTMFNRAIDKLALFPQIIAALSLFAGAVIIANTVALAMLERRREIGVLKAVGAKRRTILQFLFVEDAIVGFIGAGVGVLLAMAATAAADQLLLKISPSFSLVTIVPLIVLGMALSVGAGALTALPASTEKPMNVLRYE
jgi:ABC-type antimicrobial peptide transport system permease subunit